MAEYEVAGWGKDLPARTWHFYVTDPADQWATVSLCGKWRGTISAAGVVTPRLYGYQPLSGSVYGQCKVCTARQPHN